MSWLARLEKGTRAEAEVKLSPEDLGIAKTNLRFALENCPVDGGILTDDEGTSSEESVRALLRKLDAIKARSVGARDLADGDIRLLKAVADYAIQECPIDGALNLDSGTLISKADIRAVREKVVALQRAPVPKRRTASAIETLEEEHRLISRVVRLLPAIRRSVEAGAVDELVLSDAIEFFSAFTDGFHHAEEEDLLFPALLQRGVSQTGCPVGTLKLEHQQGRNLINGLNAAVKRYREGDVEEATTISEILGNATELYTNHIWRENYLLFPMSEKVLSDSDRRALAKDFAGVQGKFGSGFLERYTSLVERLERNVAQEPAQGAVRRGPIVSS